MITPQHVVIIFMVITIIAILALMCIKNETIQSGIVMAFIGSTILFCVIYAEKWMTAKIVNIPQDEWKTVYKLDENDTFELTLDEKGNLSNESIHKNESIKINNIKDLKKAYDEKDRDFIGHLTIKNGDKSSTKKVILLKENIFEEHERPISDSSKIKSIKYRNIKESTRKNGAFIMTYSPIDKNADGEIRIIIETTNGSLDDRFK